MKRIKDSYEVKLRCATCGCEDQFESTNASAESFNAK